MKLWLARALRWSTAIAREFSEGGLNLHAMGLVYTTLLSMVPLLAVSFSVLQAFGVHNAIEPFLLEMVAPLGARGEQIVARITGFLDNMKVGVLGSLGFALLFYTVTPLTISGGRRHRAAFSAGSAIISACSCFAFAEFVANSTQYGAIYSSFAILIVFMIWVYVSWLVLLMGAQVSFFYQYPQYTRVKQRVPQISIQIKERIGLLSMYHIGERFRRGASPLSMEELVEMLLIPWEWAAETLQILKQNGLVLEVYKEDLGCGAQRTC
ncbi:MAG: YhjD/YihY/BrkB family envelope integrity protein [Gammaproteobacteria bacterium]